MYFEYTKRVKLFILKCMNIDSVEDAASTLYEYGSSATTELKNIVSTSASETSESIQTTVDDVVYNE